MSAAAEETFGATQADAAEAAVSHLEPREMTACVLTPAPPPWRPRLPLWCRWWPARLVGSRLERMLSADADRWLTTLRASVLDAFQKKATEVVDRVAGDLMGQIETAEASVLHVVGQAAANSGSQTAPATVRQPAEQAERRLRVERRLEGLRDQILDGSDARAATEEFPFIPAEVIGAVKGRRRGAETGADAATSNLAKRNCPVCDDVTRALFEFFCEAQYTLANDELAQRLHAEEAGFCALHTWHLSSIASPFGLSVAYPKLAERLAAELAALAAADPPARGGAVERLRANPETCRACQVMHEAERKHVEQMIPRLTEPAYRAAYSRSHGVCQRHLAMLLDATEDKAIARYLLTEAARRFVELGEDMQSYAMKWDATRRSLLNRDEADAHLRTLVHLVGARYLSTPNPADAEF